MSRYLQEFLSQYPKANVRLEYLHPHRVYEAVENDQADLGLVSYPQVVADDRGHRLARRADGAGLRAGASAGRSRATLRFEELAGETVIGFDSDLTIRREIDRVLQLHEAEVRVVMEFDNIETIKRADRDRRRRGPAARADRAARSRGRHAGGGAAGDRRAGAAAGHHSSPRQGAGQHGAAIHRAVASRRTGWPRQDVERGVTASDHEADRGDERPRAPRGTGASDDGAQCCGVIAARYGERRSSAQRMHATEVVRSGRDSVARRSAAQVGCRRSESRKQG